MKSSTFKAFLILITTSSVVAYSQTAEINDAVMEVVPDHLAYLYSVKPQQGPHDISNQLIADQRKWENGRVLRVCFYNGNPVTVKLIRTVAEEWNTVGGIRFSFGPSESGFNCLSPTVGFPEIRISFSSRGYWSYVGTDSERFAAELAPSMNFDSFNRIYHPNKFNVNNVVDKATPYHKATIRHEFGHALGLLHEHQNPNLNCHAEIKWDGPSNVYEYFGGPNNYWTKEEVDRNLGFIGMTDPDYKAGQPDPKSVMMYSLPPSIFKSNSVSKCSVSANHEISDKDRAMIAKFYPKSISNQQVAAIPISIESANIRPAPSFSNSVGLDNFVQRTVIDLESDDRATRRNARARLAEVFAGSSDKEYLDSLVLKIPDASYRYQLGISTALAGAKSKVELSPPAAAVLSTQRKMVKDKTLSSALKTAELNIQ